MKSKLYQVFLSEQLIDIVLDVVKRLAEHEKEKIGGRCNMQFSIMKIQGKDVKLREEICHLNGQLAYYQIIANGLEEKMIECKNTQCKEKLKNVISNSMSQMDLVKNKIVVLRQQLGNIGSTTNA